MAHLKDIPPRPRASIEKLACPAFEQTVFAAGPDLNKRRVAVVSTAGLHRRGDKRFSLGASDYRVIPRQTAANDIVMSHVSINFDRTGFLQDLNVVLPLDRLAELAEDKVIGSVADKHYS